MFRNLTILLLALLVILFSIAPAASAVNDSDVLRATLKNGLRVVIVRNTLAPVVTTEINYLVGSDEAPDGFPGAAHAVEHMMFRGGPGLTKDQLAAVAANMGGAFNADTNASVTQYFFATPARDLKV
ncbi:MAG: M16 family metallopeptidase, partial [Candidatus Saccharimonadales bacterium]